MNAKVQGMGALLSQLFVRKQGEQHKRKVVRFSSSEHCRKTSTLPSCKFTRRTLFQSGTIIVQRGNCSCLSSPVLIA